MNETNPTHSAVVLLHSNDIHSRLENAAKIASYIHQTRLRYGEEQVLALDIGDHMDRARLETEGSDGEANIALLHAAGYDAVTLGNNEGLTLTADQLERAYGGGTSFLTLCANLKRRGETQRPSWMKPSTIMTRGGIRFGLIGATAAYTEFYRLLDWDVAEPMDAIREEVEALRPHADVVVLLSHLGILYDRRIAAELEGIDLILGAHTHHLLEQPEVYGHTYVCAAGKFGEYVGRVEVGLDPMTRQPRVHAECVPMSALEEYEPAAAVTARYLESGKHRLGRVVAELREPLPARPDQESPLCNLLAYGLRRWTGTEIGLVNAGQLLGGLSAGEVTEGQIHALCPSPINPCSMALSGRALLRALEESLLDAFIDKPIKGFGFRGLVLGMLAVDGLDIRWDPSAPDYNKITRITLSDGHPFDLDRAYTVGTIDMFTFGAGYESIKLGTEVRYYLPEFIRGVLALQLQSEEALKDCLRPRWTAEPGVL
ncbi:bifunctional metallophosphatase/5'-nucleotidase [Paenibacillus xanthanilyticus]|uniref:Bifunctional metallophosphatase/5'-nucleotidase n=1 Tax=Paenibacillus xanthanilyticus TaxID=1783531 RepID=A0ABV8K9V3_9BACL